MDVVTHAWMILMAAGPRNCHTPPSTAADSSFVMRCAYRIWLDPGAKLQLFGGYGYMAEYPIARMFTDSRIQKIYGGTNEIMKMIIGRTL
jgi:hypothetical protein